jgi:methylglutaconyl-CoA hydratase
MLSMPRQRLFSALVANARTFQTTGLRAASLTEIQQKEPVQLSYLTEAKQGIAVIEMNRPEAKNALGKDFVKKMFHTVDVLAGDKNVRVVIIKSAVPKVFCSGADLKERVKMSMPEVNRFVKALRQLMTNIEQLPMPVIAAMDGVALGGGLEMALACDIRTCADNINLGLVETRLAIFPGAGGAQRLPRLVNRALAKELIYTSRVLSGKEAQEMGIVNYSLPQNEKNDAAFQKALEIAEKILPNGPIGVQMAKKAIDRGCEVRKTNNQCPNSCLK